MNTAKEAYILYMNNPPSTIKSFKTKAKIPDPLPEFVSAKDDCVNYNILYRLEDVAFPYRNELKHFQDTFMYGGTSLSQEVRDLEYRWGEIYFEPLVEFMGDRSLWEALGIHVPDTNIRSAKSSLSRLDVTDYDVAYFSGSHWLARKAGTKDVFDPYDEYQVHGTNQFCQTFCMMYLRNKLPTKITGNDWLKYYTYTKEALEFIDGILKMCKKSPRLRKLPLFDEPNTTFDNLERAIDVCKKHSRMCLNIVMIP